MRPELRTGFFSGLASWRFDRETSGVLKLKLSCDSLSQSSPNELPTGELRALVSGLMRFLRRLI